jgi:hypothetical protein
MPVAVLYNLNVAFALASLTNLNVPMYARFATTSAVQCIPL